ncbi:MAG: MFS transporter, partial [Desulfobacterales bacterium]
MGAPSSVESHSETSPFTIRNVRLFIAFRVFFNARFYYPVFTILFLDFGLTLEQFALLNAAWAASIVLLEVPSGALADTFGRRNLLVLTGVLMVIEIALLCFVPLGNVDLLFVVFLVNRILSG